MKSLTKLVLMPAAFVLASLVLPFKPANAQAPAPVQYGTNQTYINFSGERLAKPALKKEAVFNFFFKPNALTTIAYGDGDVNKDTKVDYNDLDAMKSGTQNDQSYVDGDGIQSAQSDISLLENHLQTGAILPGDWNNLKEFQQRESWAKKMISIDKTDLIPPVETGSNKWVCHHYATQTHLNFFGFEKFNPEDLDIPLKFDTTQNGRFNLPVYYINVYTPNPPASWKGSVNHTINGILLGNNPLNFNDWYFFEPQDDTKVIPGTFSMPKNCKVYVKSIHEFASPPYEDLFGGFSLVDFEIVNRQANLIWNDERLTLTRPDSTIVAVDESNTIPSAYLLNQNYPNPFNISTTIEFSVPKSENVLLEVYNSNGQKLETLATGYQPAGNHKLNWNASRYSSGMYFYMLKSGDFSASRRMMLVK